MVNLGFPGEKGAKEEEVPQATCIDIDRAVGIAVEYSIGRGVSYLG